MNDYSTYYYYSKVETHLSLCLQDWGNQAQDSEYKYVLEQKT